MGNRLFTTQGIVNIKPTTYSRRDNDYHANGGVEKSNSDVQRGTAMSGSSNAVVKSNTTREVETFYLIVHHAIKPSVTTDNSTRFHFIPTIILATCSERIQKEKCVNLAVRKLSSLK